MSDTDTVENMLHLLAESGFRNFEFLRDILARSTQDGQGEKVKMESNLRIATEDSERIRKHIAIFVARESRRNLAKAAKKEEAKLLEALKDMGELEKYKFCLQCDYDIMDYDDSTLLSMRALRERVYPDNMTSTKHPDMPREPHGHTDVQLHLEVEDEDEEDEEEEPVVPGSIIGSINTGSITIGSGKREE